MTTFQVHTLDSAPNKSRPILESIKKKMGLVPNLYACLAESPAALKAYLSLSDIMGQTDLSPVEQQVVLLVVSAENGCEYCVSAHSVIAKNSAKADPRVVSAIRDGSPVPDDKLQALAAFARQVVVQRGWVSTEVIAEFLAAGYTKANVLDVIVGVTMKTLSNYANHTVNTPIDAMFQSELWSKSETI